MKRSTFMKAGMAAMALSFVMMIALTGCPTESDPDPVPRTYTVTANGSADGAVTTELTVTFDAAESGLTAGEITIAGTTAAKIGILIGSGPEYTLPVSVTQKGEITVTIAKNGVDSSPKTVAVHKPELDGLLREYMGPQEQTWDAGENVKVYQLDPLRVKKFKAELDAGGAYHQTEIWEIEERNWALDEHWARWNVRLNGTFRLEVYNEDLSAGNYSYRKESPGGADTWLEIVGRYMGSENQTWGDDPVEDAVKVYYLDFARFDAFKTALDAGGEYYQLQEREDNPFQREEGWDPGKNFARWGSGPGVQPIGTFQLTHGKSDGQTWSYSYKKIPQVDASWEEDDGDKGKVKFTYLGTEAPPGAEFGEEKSGAWYQYKGYYEIEYLWDANKKQYLYYPETGGQAQRSDIQE